MPAQILHTLFGEDLIAELQHPRFSLVSERLVKKIQGDHWAVFALGCQGPDIFYHSQMTLPVALEYGTLLHRRGFGDFTASLLKRTIPDLLADGEDSSLGIYALGFMTHAFLDRLTHPYIVYKSGVVSPASHETAGFIKRFPRGTAHAFFERILDVLMLDLLRGQSLVSWEQKALTQVCAEPPQGLRELLIETLEEVFPERAGRDSRLFQRINNTLRDCALFYRLTDPAYTSFQRRISATQDPKIPLAYLYPEQIPLSIDYLNLGRGTWYYPTVRGGADNRAFPEIYHGAVKIAGDTLGRILFPRPGTGPLPLKDLARSLGNGGLSIVDETGKSCIPARVGTLPLDEVIIQQETLRNLRSELSILAL